jgi:hypothetical protein
VISLMTKRNLFSLSTILLRALKEHHFEQLLEEGLSTVLEEHIPGVKFLATFKHTFWIFGDISINCIQKE